MKAWQIHDGEVQICEVEPVHPADGEAVVGVSYAGVCGSDLPKLLFPNDFTVSESWRPGHEIVGTHPSGHTVAVDPLVPCQDCDRCVEGDSHLCLTLRRLGWDLPGGFAEQVAVPTANAHPLPNGLDPLRAVLADPAAVAIHGLRCTPINPPRRLGIVGAGVVGLLTTLYAHQQGWEVTVLHRDSHAPPQAIFDTFPAAFRRASTPAEHTFDVVVDAASGADATALELALRLVRDGGAIVVQNAYQPDVCLPVTLRSLFRRSIRLIGCFSHCRRGPGDFELGLHLLGQHSDSVTHLINRIGTLADLDALLSGPTTGPGRPVLTVGARRRERFPR